MGEKSIFFYLCRGSRWWHLTTKSMFFSAVCLFCQWSGLSFKLHEAFLPKAIPIHHKLVLYIVAITKVEFAHLWQAKSFSFYAIHFNDQRRDKVTVDALHLPDIFFSKIFFSKMLNSKF